MIKNYTPCFFITFPVLLKLHKANAILTLLITAFILLGYSNLSARQSIKTPVLLVNNISENRVSNNYFVNSDVKNPKLIVNNVSNLDKDVYHLFTHGRPGELFINNKWLNKQQIVAFIKELKLSVSSLNIYGCQFAKGKKGKQAVAYIQKETMLQVSASTNITGKDGDWFLEVGNIDYGDVDYAFNLQTCAGTVGGTGTGDDFDGDGVCNEVDLDDDNDGILDTTELGCGRGFATGQVDNSNLMSGTFTFGSASADFTNAITDTNVAAVNTRFANGVHYAANDSAPTGEFQEVITVTSGAGTILNTIVYGNEVATQNLNSANGAQDITFTWDSGGLATVVDPNDKLSLDDGATFASGTTISVDATGNSENDIWFIEFDAALTSMMTLTVNHNADSGLSLETFGFDASLCRTNDDDQDGTLNHQQLDSDGDGSSDATEAGVSGVLNDEGTLENAIAQGPYGANGLANGVETSEDSGEVNYQDTYQNARDNNTNTRPIDTDGDNINDDVDIDDDNDGILDEFECGSTRNFVEFAASDVASAIGLNLPGTITGPDQNGNMVTITFSTVEGTSTSGAQVGNANTTVNGIQFRNNSRLVTGLRVEATVPMYGVQYTDFDDVDNDVAVLPNPMPDGSACPTPPQRNERDVWGIDQAGVYNILAGNLAVPTSHIASDLPDLASKYEQLGVSQLVIGNPEELSCGANQEVTPNSIMDDTTLNFLAPTTVFRMYGSNAAPDFITTATAIDPVGTYRYYLSPQGCQNTDGDGIPNNLDLDSDNDGCSDFSEAFPDPHNEGSVTTVNSDFGTDWGTNGFEDSLETSADSGVAATGVSATANSTAGYASALDVDDVDCVITFLAVDDSASVIENSSVTIDVFDNDTGVETNTVVTIETQPTNGTVTINNGGTPDDTTDDVVVYTPNSGFFGTDSFTYMICDVSTPPNCNTATVIVDILLDTDGDNVSNEDDLDDDNDGILDTVECPNDLGEGNFNNWDNPSGNWTLPASGSFIRNSVDDAVSPITFTQDGLTGLTELEFTFSIRGSNMNNSPSTTSFMSLFFSINGVNYVEWENTTATATAFPIPGNLNITNGAQVSPATFNVNSTGLTQYTVTVPWTSTEDEAIVEFRQDAPGGNDDFVVATFSFSRETSLHLCVDTDTDGVANHLDTDSDNDGCPDAVEAAGSFTSDQLTTLLGGSPTANSSSDNFGTTVSSDTATLGVPTENSATPTPVTVTLPQGTTVAVLDSTNVVACTADLSLVKIVDKSIVKVNDKIIYTLTVTNSGPNSTTGVEITDALPSGLTYLPSGSGTDIPTGTTYNTTPNVWVIGDMALNETKVLKLEATVNGAGTFVNNARVSKSSQTDTDSDPTNSN